jgi:glycosyltransferase involved in cell wall biosynthesis
VLVSKPLGPPWSDGSSRLVAELVDALAAVDQRQPPRYGVHVKGGYDPPGPSVSAIPLGSSDRWRNLAMTARLLTPRGARVYGFFFAPHPAAVAAARVVSRTAGVVPVQIVCSQPRSFRSASALCFGWKVVTLSPWTRERFVAGGVAASRVVVIPPPLRIAPAPSRERIEAARATLRLERATRVVVFPGDAEPGGGVRTLTAALPELVRRIPGTVVVIACRPKTSRAALELGRIRSALGRADALESVRIVGAVDDFQALLACADLCVLPATSLYAKVDYPYAVLEAMSLGVPQVVAQGTAIAELIEREGGGRTVPGHAPGALASVVTEILSDGASLGRLGAEARRVVAARCDPGAIASRYVELFEEAEQRGHH